MYVFFRNSVGYLIAESTPNLDGDFIETLASEGVEIGPEFQELVDDAERFISFLFL